MATYFVDLDATDDFPEEATTVSTGGLFGLIATVAIGQPPVIIRFNEEETDEILLLPGTIRSLGRPPSRPIKTFQVKSTSGDTDSVVTLEFTEEDQRNGVIPTGATGPQGPAGDAGDAGTPLQATLKMAGPLGAPAPGATIPFVSIVGTAPPLNVRTDPGHEGRITIPANTTINLSAFVAATPADLATSAGTAQFREVDVDGVSIGLYGDAGSSTTNVNSDDSAGTLEIHLRETVITAEVARYFELELTAATSLTNILATSRVQIG